jgi:hypothetical protein
MYFKRESYKAVEYFIKKEIPYNLLWLKSKSFENFQEATVKFFIFPVRPCYGKFNILYKINNYHSVVKMI